MINLVSLSNETFAAATSLDLVARLCKLFEMVLLFSLQTPLLVAAPARVPAPLPLLESLAKTALAVIISYYYES